MKPIEGIKIQFTDEQLQHLKDRYLSGESTDSLSARYGISKCTTRRRLRALGVELRAPGKVLQVTDRVKAGAKAMREKGVKWRDIGKAFGINPSTLETAIRRSSKV